MHFIFNRLHMQIHFSRKLFSLFRLITKHGSMLRSMQKNPMFHYLHLRTFSHCCDWKTNGESCRSILRWMSIPEGSRVPENLFFKSCAQRKTVYFSQWICTIGFAIPCGHTHLWPHAPVASYSHNNNGL